MTDEKDNIAVLMQEYNSLRSWVFSRVNNAYQLIGIGPAALAILLTVSQVSGALLIVALILAMAGFSLGLCLTVLDVQQAGIRLLELEKEINRRAGQELLQWETRFGGRFSRRLLNRLIPN